MKKTTAFATVATIALLGGFAHRAQGQTYIYQETQSATVSSWTTGGSAGTLAYQTGASPESDSGGATQDNDGGLWANATGYGVNGNGSLGQAFVVNQAGYLNTAQLVMAGGTQSFSVELYDLGPAGANFPSGSPQGSGAGNAPSITQLSYPTITPGSGAGSTDLLKGLGSFTFASPSSQDLVTLNFTGGSDAPLLLNTGELYMLALDPTSAASGTWWDRGGVPVAAYNTGEGFNADGTDGYQNFEGKSSIRDFDLGVTVTPVVPEPSTMALFGMGAFAWGALRRRIK